MPDDQQEEDGDQDTVQESVDKFLVSLEESISNKCSEAALMSIFDRENEELIKLGSLDILNMVGERMKGGRRDEDVGEWHNLESMLQCVVLVSKPREMLIGLLSLLEMAGSDEFFKLVLDLLRSVFLRLPTQRGDMLLCALSQIDDYLGTLPIPMYAAALEPDEKVTLENAPELNRIEPCLTAALDFCQPFVEEANQCLLITSSSERRLQQIQAIGSFLMKTVECPLAYFFSSSSSGGNMMEEVVNRLIGTIFDLKSDALFSVIDWHESGRLSMVCRFTDDSKKNGSKIVDSIAVGVLASAIYARGVSADRMPKVYNYEYIFERLLPYIGALLGGGPNLPYAELGVDLLDAISQRLPPVNYYSTSGTFWEAGRLGQRAYEELFLNLINVMTYARSDHVRKLALTLFTRYMAYFQPTGQMMIIRLVYYVFQRQQQPSTQVQAGEEEEEGGGKSNNKQWYFGNRGICGYLIDYYRGKVNEEVNNSRRQREQANEGPFLSNLPQMLALFTNFPQREETDFLDNYDQCTAALNLIRYLCLVRLKDDAAPFPPSRFTRLAREFVEPTRKGLQLSKAHYELDLKKMRNTTAADSNLGQEEVLKSAINAFDLMMSLVARVAELLDARGKLVK